MILIETKKELKYPGDLLINDRLQEGWYSVPKVRSPDIIKTLRNKVGGIEVIIIDVKTQERYVLYTVCRECPHESVEIEGRVFGSPFVIVSTDMLNELEKELELARFTVFHGNENSMEKYSICLTYNIEIIRTTLTRS